MHILAATDFSTRSQRALRRAGLLARSSGAELALVHVVDDDQPDELVGMETREAERILAEQIDAMAELRGVQCRPMVVTGDPFDAILRTAAGVDVDLIVVGAHRKQLLRDIFVGTTIERVIRTGRYPVLMVNTEVAHPYRTVLAPVDMSEASANAIKVADAIGLLGDTRLTLLHAFVPLAEGKMATAGFDRPNIDQYVASERERAKHELASFLVLHDLQARGWPLQVRQGVPFEVISNALEETRPDLLVMGTHGRSGLAKILLGSLTEEVLRSLNVDVLAVPPVREPG